MTQYNKITALYSRLSVGDEDRDGGESNSIVNQKAFLERYARQEKLTNIRHYIDDDESGRFFDRSAYVRMMDDVENGKIGIVVMKDMTRWGRDYLQVGNAMEIFRRNRVRFIAFNNGIDSEKPDTLEFAPFINIMSEWYAKDISKKEKTGIKTKGMSGKPIATEAPYVAFTELTPAILNEFIGKILVHERDVKRSKYAVHRIEVYFNHIGRFENELTEQIELTEQECERMRAEIEEAKREKSRAYHRAYYKEYRKKNLERCREYERMKAREYRAKKKLQAAT